MIQADMKGVGIISSGEVFGGIEKHILELSKWLYSNGVRVEVVLFSQGVLAQKLKEAGVPVEVVRPRCTCDPILPFTLARAISRRNLGVVHTHGYRATLNCALAQRITSFKMVQTVHGKDEIANTQFIGKLKDQGYSILERAGARLAKADICFVTKELARLYGRRYPDNKKCVIYNGLEVPGKIIAEKPDILEPTRFNLGLFARLIPVKGIGIAIEAIRLLGASTRVKLYIFGDGPLKNTLLEQSRGLEGVISFQGFRHDVVDFVPFFDALVVPSLHEGMPFVLLEALAYGRPVIASRVGGMAEVLENGKNALLVPPHSSQDLAVAINKVSEDSGLAEILGNEAYDLYCEKFNVEGMGRAYFDVYYGRGNSLSG